MRYAAFILVLCFAAMAGLSRQQPEPSQPESVEVKMFDESGTRLVGTAVVPTRLAAEYREVSFYEGENPPPGTDFDIVAVPMKEGGDVYLLCIK